jgi:pimeloyl-ACP methyl ester carboxylesterase
LVIQNGNAYEEGLKEFWDPFKVYWDAPTEENGAKLKPFFELDATIWQYTHGIPDDAVELVSPDNWHHDQHLLDRPGNKDIQLKMFFSYGTNVPEYAKWQALFRDHQPPALIMWGRGDQIFPVDGAHPYERDLEDVEKHILDTGHFALETHLDFMAERILAFLGRTSK